VVLLPTCTLPKLTGLTLRLPGAVPMPERGMVKVEATLSLAMARFTLLLPANWGENTTLNKLLLPGARIKGRLRPVTLYPEPAAACVSVMLEPPVLVTVSGRALLPPT
jgi:hypothetical protein